MARRPKLRVVRTRSIEVSADSQADLTATLPASDAVKAAAVGVSTRDSRDQPTAVLFESLAAAGGETDQRRLRGQITKLNMDIARETAWRCRGFGEALEDLQQVADSALAMAVARYDSSRGTPFHVFATRTILGHLKAHVRDRA